MAIEARWRVQALFSEAAVAVVAVMARVSCECVCGKRGCVFMHQQASICTVRDAKRDAAFLVKGPSKTRIGCHVLFWLT